MDDVLSIVSSYAKGFSLFLLNKTISRTTLAYQRFSLFFEISMYIKYQDNAHKIVKYDLRPSEVVHLANIFQKKDLERIFNCLDKLDNKHASIVDNIRLSLKEIPKLQFENIIKGAYRRPEKYITNTAKKHEIIKKYK